MKRVMLFIAYCMSIALVYFAQTNPITLIEAQSAQQVAGVSIDREAKPTGVPLIDEINRVRVASNRQPLVIDPELMQTALTRSDDMIRHQYYAHVSPQTGENYSAQLSPGRNYSCENLNLTITNGVEAIIDSWLNSTDGHRECLLSNRVAFVGFSSKPFVISDTEKSHLTTLILASD